MKKTNKQSEQRSFLQKAGEKKALVTLAIIGVLVVVFLILHFFQETDVESASENMYDVHIVQEEDPLLFDGMVEAREIQEAFYDPSLGVISEVLVENGESVEEGIDLLTYINEENQKLLNELNRQYDRLQSRLSESETELANARNALSTANTNIAQAEQTIKEMDQTSSETFEVNPEYENTQSNLMEYESDKAEAEATIDAAELTIRELTEQREDLTYEIDEIKSDITTTVKADFSGIVERLSENRENLVSSEEPIVRLVSEGVQVEATISEYDYDKISENSPVVIHLTNSDNEVDGTITKISSLPLQMSAESSSSRYAFTVRPEEAIQYGFSVQVAFSEERIYLPDYAVVEEDNQYIAYVVKEGIVERREIDVKEEGNLYLLNSGLESGDEVVISPEPDLTDGDEITVMYDYD